MTEFDRRSAAAAPADWGLSGDAGKVQVTTAVDRTAPGSTGWTVRPHGSVGPRRLAGFAALAATSQAPVSLVMTPSSRAMIGNAPPAAPTWRLRVRGTPPVVPSRPAQAVTATQTSPGEDHLAARVIVAAVSVTVLATIASQFRSSAPGQQPVVTSRVATASTHRIAPPVARPPSPPPAVSTHLYRVVAGDSMSAIATRHSISLASLTHANPQVHDIGLIHVGDLVRLP